MQNLFSEICNEMISEKKQLPSLQNQERAEDVIKLLKQVGSFKFKYPPDLFDTRRVAFIAQVEQHNAKERVTVPS
jgi:hypothetical protein